MSALSYLLERLRRVQLPPGAAAGVMAVPSLRDELSHEVDFLFGQLDEAERRGELLLSAIPRRVRRRASRSSPA